MEATALTACARMAAALDTAIAEAVCCARHGEVAVVPVDSSTADQALLDRVAAWGGQSGLIVVNTGWLVRERDPDSLPGFVRGLRSRAVLLVVGSTHQGASPVSAGALAAAVARAASVVVLLRPPRAGEPGLDARAPVRREAGAAASYLTARAPRVFRVAEGGIARTAVGVLPGACCEPPEPAPVARARALAGAGRRAAGEAVLRSALSRLVHPLAAGERLACRLELARYELEMGRLAAAHRTIGEPSDLAEPGPRADLAWDALIVDALVRLERREFARATEMLSTAFEATAATWPNVALRAGLGLMRCLFWAGHPRECERWAQRVSGLMLLPPSAAVDVAWRRARLARHAGDAAEAARIVRAIAADDERASGPRERAGLLVERAALALAAGDTSRARERVDEARRLVARSGDLVRARVEADWLDIVVDGATGTAGKPLGVAVPRASERLTATPLLEWRRREALARGGRRSSRAAAPRTSALQEGRARMVNELAELIDLVNGRDPGEVPAAVCEWLHARLAAVSVACFDTANPAAPCRLEGSGGPRWPSRATVSAAAEGRGVAVWMVDEGATEVGTPLVAGNRTDVVMAARWPAAAPPDRDAAAAIIDAALAVARGAIHAVAGDRRRQPAPEVDAFGLVGVSDAMRTIREAVRRASLAPFPVLIEGESGSGKELIARAIHAAGPRRPRRFCAVNCAAMSDDLVEGELFGHARGAFTGALHERAGLFEEADRGTLFLDEVGELSARAQAKLLRALQEGEVRRIGENMPRRVDVRIVAATNRILAAEVERGAFRPDLRYRLDVLHIHVPPLRERRDDIALLVAHLWRGLAPRASTDATLSPPLIDALSRYDWPGNVRELQNVLATLAVHAPRRGRLGADLLPQMLNMAAIAPAPATLDEARRQFEAQFVRDALARCGGRRTDAARALGLSRQGLAKTLVRLGLQQGVVLSDGQ